MLALALLTITPVARATAALRAALVADAARRAGPRRRAAPRAVPDRRVRAALARIPGWAIVAGGVPLAVLVWLAYWSLSTHVFQNDEDQYVYLSRWLQTDFPASLWDFDAYGPRPPAARGLAAGDPVGAVRLALVAARRAAS